MTRGLRRPGPAVARRGSRPTRDRPAPPIAAANAGPGDDAPAATLAGPGADAPARLTETAAALGLPLAHDALVRLLRYLALLQRWNATYNLTAVRDPQAMLTQHLVDCMAVVPALSRHLDAAGHVAPAAPAENAPAESAPAAPARLRVLDVGSGGGLPGVVLAILMPRLDVTCVDTVGKKAAFIRQVAGELQLTNLHAAHARVESLPVATRAAGFDVITSRAFASLADFTRLTTELLAAQGVWMAMKGRAPDDELAALPGSVEMFHVEPLHVPGLHAERCLVWMRPKRAPSKPAPSACA